MGLTEELIEFCRKSLGEIERIIVNSEANELAPYGTKHERWMDWRFHKRAKDVWSKWHGSLNFRLERLGIQTVQNPSFTELVPFAVFQPALRSIQKLADGGSIEAMEALCQLAIFSTRGVQHLRRVQYIREHPYPWQERSRTAREEVKDADVSEMLKDVGKVISVEEQGRKKKPPQS